MTPFSLPRRQQRYRTTFGQGSTTSPYSCQEGPYRSRRTPADRFLIPMPKAPYGPQSRPATSTRADGMVDVPIPQVGRCSRYTRTARSSSVILSPADAIKGRKVCSRLSVATGATPLPQPPSRCIWLIPLPPRGNNARASLRTTQVPDNPRHNIIKIV